jgi:septal ring factor EnvC (AmiA/AmiB activator)
LIDKNLREELQSVRDELDLSKEKIQMHLKELARLEPYKKRSEEMAQTKADLRECEAAIARLRDDNEVLQKEKANFKEVKSALEFLEEQLTHAKTKSTGFEQ